MDILHFLLSVTFVSWVFDEKKRKTHQETKGRNRWKKMRCQLPKDNERQWEVDFASLTRGLMGLSLMDSGRILINQPKEM